MTSKNRVTLSGVTKIFSARRSLAPPFRKGADRVALSEISFTVEPRELVALAGPNGSGKTTLIRILAGVIYPTGGNVASIDSMTYISAAERQFSERLTGFENLRFFARIGGIPLSEIRPACAAIGLQDTAVDEPVWTYSSGMKHRLALARALLGKSELVLLDEPTRSLDKAGRADIAVQLRTLKEHATVIVATHDEDILAACDRVIRLEEGRLAS